MNRYFKIIVVLFLFLFLLSTTAYLTGCSKKTSESNDKTTNTEIKTGLKELLEKSKNISSIQYDLIISVPNSNIKPAQQKVWLKGYKQRIDIFEEGEVTAIYILDYEKKISWNYIPKEEVALEIDLQDALNFAGKSILEETQSINVNSKVIATETYEGKECLVILSEGTNNESAKIWLWKEKGIVVKMETLASSNISLLIMEYKNISFSDLSDTVFQIPEGVQIIKPPMP